MAKDKLQKLRAWCKRQHVMLWAEQGQVCVGDFDPKSPYCGSFAARRVINRRKRRES